MKEIGNVTEELAGMEIDPVAVPMFDNEEIVLLSKARAAALHYEMDEVWMIDEIDGRWRVCWWTNDNLDQGYPTEEAGRVVWWDTELEAHAHARGGNVERGLIKHSWLGWLYGAHVGVFIDGKLLSFEDM